MDKAVEELQGEFKLLKNEIKETLTDIREHLLTNAENPFAVELERAEAAPRARGNAGTIDAAITVNVTPTPTLPLPEVGELPGLPPESENDNIEGFDEEESTTDEDTPTSEDPDVTQWMGEMTDGRPVQDELQSSGLDEGEAVDQSFSGTHTAPPPNKDQGAPQVDLVMLATLTPWIESSIQKIGKPRVKSVVDLYSSIENVPPQLKEIVHQFIDLGSEQEAFLEDSAAILSDSLHVLMELDALLWRSRYDRKGAALLSLLLDRNGTPPQSEDLFATE